MSNSSGPLPLKTLRLKALREEEMMFPVGASTSGVRRLQRRRPPSPPSRRKTKRGLREEGIMRRKRKGKPILQVLLIASLAINTTLSFVILANRNRMGQPTEKKESVATPAVITLEGATVESKVPTAASPVSQPRPLVAKKTVAPEATARRYAPARMESPSRERDEISFFPTPALYRLQRDTVLVTRRDGARILIPQGTLVRVAGISRDDRALVVSHRGNPDGLIARSSLEQIPDELAERVVPDSSAPLRKAMVNAPRRAADTSGPFRLSGGPYGGSIGLSGAQIFVGQNGQISGSLSR
jgi:hypothetical protein